MDETMTTESSGTLITDAAVLDPDSGDSRRADVLIRADRIAEVVARGDARDFSHVDGISHVDGEGCLLVPGLIDCHAHVAFPAAEPLPRSARILEATSTLRRLLSRGITTVRDAWGADAGFGHALRTGWIEGPDLLVSLMQLGPTGGLSDAWQPDAGSMDWLGDPSLPDPLFDGPDAARAAVRRMVRAGAEWIKVGASGSLRDVRNGRDVRPTDAELAAMVDEARRCGRDVMAHAHTTDSAIAAARSGVRSIEHGILMDEAALETIRTHGCWYVPTLAPVTEDDPVTEIESHRRIVRLAAEAGVPIAAGSDMALRPHVDLLTELRLLAEVLDDDRAALCAATSEAARLLRLDQDRGRIAPGFRADLVLLEGPTLEVARLPERIRQVWKNGRPVHGPRDTRAENG